MSLYVLDTDTLTLFQHGHAIVTNRCAARPAGEVAITAISVEEQLDGRISSIRRARRPDDLALAYQRLIDSLQSLTRLPVLPFSPLAIARFQHLAAMKLNVGRMDLRIAATALEVGATVVTRNRRDFGRIPGLQVEDWSI
jgi:tRNA(fMet)-specific endonuclease VapC